MTDDRASRSTHGEGDEKNGRRFASRIGRALTGLVAAGVAAGAFGIALNQLLAVLGERHEENRARADRTIEIIRHALTVTDHFANNPVEIDPDAQSFPPEVDALRTDLEGGAAVIPAAEPCLVLLINGVGAYTVGAWTSVDSEDGITRPAAQALRDQARILRGHVLKWRARHSDWWPSWGTDETDTFLQDCKKLY